MEWLFSVSKKKKKKIEAKVHCFNPEGFTSFIALLESIPSHVPSPDYQLFEHSPLVLRYLLKKRLACGSYGKVLLAFHGNCQEVFSSEGENVNCFVHLIFGSLRCQKLWLLF